MKKVISIISLFVFCSVNLQAADDPLNAKRTYDQGMLISSKGNIKALAIFVQFRGDNALSADWPVNQAPAFLNTFIDSSLNQSSIPWSLSDYYRRMSNDSLRIYGKGYFAVTQHTERYYRDTLGKGNNAFSFSTKEVLAALDSQINYAEYDHWAFRSGKHSNTADGKVDLIIVLYRNSQYPSGSRAQGIALLGQGITDTTLDGTTIGFEFWGGSGITNSGGYLGMKTVLPSMKHEFGHRLFGGGHPAIYGHYGNQDDATIYTGMWGIMPRYGFCANAFEREKLGWIVPVTAAANGMHHLTDFVTTEMALKIPIPGTSDAFYVENHRQLSVYDSELDQVNGKGLFIYKVIGKANHPQYDVQVAEGKYDWTNYWARVMGLGNDSIPVYTRRAANRNGYDLRDWIPHNKTFSGGRFPIFIMDDDGLSGPSPYYLFNGWWGNGKTAFNMHYNRIFAPWTNPGSGNNKNISVAILSHPGDYMEVQVDVQDITIVQNSIIPAEPFEFTNNIIVPAGVTLTIQAGATLKFAAGKSLVVHGILNAIGTSSEPVTFDCSGASGTWGGLRFESNATGMLNHCNIYNAADGIYRAGDADPSVENCNIKSSTH